MAEELEVVVETFPLRDAGGALAVRTAGYGRDLPQIKHVGTFGLFYQRRLARMAGFDDALFAPDDEIAEGATWNICFRDAAGTIVWPSAPALPGVSAALIQNGLSRLGHKHEVRSVTVADLPGFEAAFASNALAPVRPITKIDEVEYAVDEETAALLRRAHDLVPEERV
ncbi:aminotransferase class IV [Actinokineospora soli]|uniref:Aminotransferase class IV n=1 Tax=Actinokineospora soli TaxID=1048753 RepID=A0ABW2TSA1_9PSEU